MPMVCLRSNWLSRRPLSLSCFLNAFSVKIPVFAKWKFLCSPTTFSVFQHKIPGGQCHSPNCYLFFSFPPCGLPLERQFCVQNLLPRPMVFSNGTTFVPRSKMAGYTSDRKQPPSGSCESVSRDAALLIAIFVFTRFVVSSFFAPPCSVPLPPPSKAKEYCDPLIFTLLLVESSFFFSPFPSCPFRPGEAVHVHGARWWGGHFPA